LTAGLTLPRSATRVGTAVIRRQGVGPHFVLKLEYGVFGIVRAFSLPRTTLAADAPELPVPFVVHRADGIAGRSDTVGAGD